MESVKERDKRSREYRKVSKPSLHRQGQGIESARTRPLGEGRNYPQISSSRNRWALIDEELPIRLIWLYPLRAEKYSLEAHHAAHP